MTGYGRTFVEILRLVGLVGFAGVVSSGEGKNSGMKSSTRLVMVAFIAGTELGDGNELVWLCLELLGGTDSTGGAGGGRVGVAGTFVSSS